MTTGKKRRTMPSERHNGAQPPSPAESDTPCEAIPGQAAGADETTPHPLLPAPGSGGATQYPILTQFDQQRYHLLTRVQAVVDPIKAITDQQDMDNLRSFHAVGMILADFDTQTLGMILRNHRENLFEAICQQVARSPANLRDAMLFAQDFSAEQLQELVDHQITVVHIRELLSAPRERREEMLQEMLARRWTLKKLCEETKRARAPKPGSVRPRGRPTTLKAGLNLLAKATTYASKDFAERLFGDDFDLPTAIRDEPPDSLTQELRDGCALEVKRLEDLGQSILDNASRLKEALPWFDRVFAARQHQNPFEPTTRR